MGRHSLLCLSVSDVSPRISLQLHFKAYCPCVLFVSPFPCLGQRLPLLHDQTWFENPWKVRTALNVIELQNWKSLSFCHIIIRGYRGNANAADWFIEKMWKCLQILTETQLQFFKHLPLTETQLQFLSIYQTW